MDGRRWGSAGWLRHGGSGDKRWKKRRFDLAIIKKEVNDEDFPRQFWETLSLPVGTTIGGGLGAMRWGAGGMGTTLTRGAGIMGGICVMT